MEIRWPVYALCEFLTQLRMGPPFVAAPLWRRKQKSSYSAGKLEHMLENIMDFKCIVFLTVARD